MQQLVKFTFHHDYAEDRIQMLSQSDDGTSLAFWLTRRLTSTMLESAQRWLTQAYASQLNVPLQAQNQVYEMYHDQARSALEQQQAMQQHSAVKLTEEVAVQLLNRIELTLLNDGELRLTLCDGELELAYSQFSVEHFHQLLHILHRKSEQLEWGLTPLTGQGSYALQ